MDNQSNRQEIVLGRKYRDRITGFTGIATARHEYLNGCVRISLTATELQDGKPLDPQSFDLEDVVVVDAGVEIRSKETGGPGDIPASRHMPSGR